jgi:hypothetical protein
MAVTELILIVVLAVSILILGARLVVQWAKRQHSDIVTVDDYSGARAALDSLFLETSAIKRIFAEDDMEFISETATADVKRFFVKERKRLAIQWLRLTQKQVTQLMDVHLKLASYTYEPSPRYEFRLTADYLCFLVASYSLLFLMWLRGPFEAARTVDYTLRGAEHFCSIFSIRLEKVDPVKLGAAR